MNFKGLDGDAILMMSLPKADYKNVYSYDYDGRAKDVESVWGFWAMTDRDSVWLFFDTPDDETYDLNNYRVYNEPREYYGE